MPRKSKMETGHDKVVPLSLPDVQLCVVNSIDGDRVDIDAVQRALQGYQLTLQGSLQTSVGFVTREVSGHSGYYRNAMRGVAHLFGIERRDEETPLIVRGANLSEDSDSSNADTFDQREFELHEPGPARKKRAIRPTSEPSKSQPDIVDEVADEVVTNNPSVFGPPSFDAVKNKETQISPNDVDGQQGHMPFTSAEESNPANSEKPRESGTASPTELGSTRLAPFKRYKRKSSAWTRKSTMTTIAGSQGRSIPEAQPSGTIGALTTTEVAGEAETVDEAHNTAEAAAEADAADEAHSTAEAAAEADAADEAHNTAEAAAEAEATDEARNTAKTAAEAEATDEARNTAEAEATDEARNTAEAEATDEARNTAEAEAVDEARNTAEAEATDEAHNTAEAEATDEAHNTAEAEATDEAHNTADSAAEAEAANEGHNTAEAADEAQEMTASHGEIAQVICSQRQQPEVASAVPCHTHPAPTINSEKEAVPSVTGELEPTAPKNADTRRKGVTATDISPRTPPNETEKETEGQKKTRDHPEDVTPPVRRLNEFPEEINAEFFSKFVSTECTLPESARVFVHFEAVDLLQKSVLPRTWMSKNKRLSTFDYQSPEQSNLYSFIRRLGEKATDSNNKTQWQIICFRDLKAHCDLLLSSEDMNTDHIATQNSVYVFDSTEFGIDSGLVLCVRNFMNGVLNNCLEASAMNANAKKKHLRRVKILVDSVSSNFVLVHMPSQPAPRYSGVYLLSNLKFLFSNSNLSQVLQTEKGVKGDRQEKKLAFTIGKKKITYNVFVLLLDLSTAYAEDLFG